MQIAAILALIYFVTPGNFLPLGIVYNYKTTRGVGS
jgi:hypothetical protein